VVGDDVADGDQGSVDSLEESVGVRFDRSHRLLELVAEVVR